MPEFATNSLRSTLIGLSADARLTELAARLQSSTTKLERELVDTVLNEIPAFSLSANPDVLPELKRHGRQHIEEILRLLSGGALGGFEFVREHARRRAEQYFPLEATLHAYRCGHKVFSRWLRNAALHEALTTGRRSALVASLADFTLEYTDTISTLAAGAYVDQTRLLADVAGDQRSQLVDVLLQGSDESDGRVTRLLRRSGFLDQRQQYCVVLAQSVDPIEMLQPQRARRVAESIAETLNQVSIHHIIDVRNNQVVAILRGVRRVSGWTAPNTALAAGVGSQLLHVGNAVLIGVSNDVSSTSQIPAAYAQAQLALDLTHVENRVLQFADIPARALLLHFAGEELRRVLPHWAAALMQTDRKMKGVLGDTIRAYAKADMNVLKAAQILAVHPNTVYARFQKIIDVSELDPRSFDPLCELLLVLDTCRD